jgi:hypothetical protein
MPSTVICLCYAICHELSHSHFWGLELREVANTLYDIDGVAVNIAGDDESKVGGSSKELLVACWRGYFVRALQEVEAGTLIGLHLLHQRR